MMVEQPAQAGPRSEIDTVKDELHLMKTAGIVEVAVRNPSVAEYMTHWEGRALVAEAEIAILRRERDEARVTLEIRDKESDFLKRRGDTERAARLSAEAKLAEAVKALEQTQTALRHASFALDGVVALDDEDMGRDGGSDTCQHAKKTVDRALTVVESVLAARLAKQDDRT